jgi:hypothetical protein
MVFREDILRIYHPGGHSAERWGDEKIAMDEDLVFGFWNKLFFSQPRLRLQ